MPKKTKIKPAGPPVEGKGIYYLNKWMWIVGSLAFLLTAMFLWYRYTRFLIYPDGTPVPVEATSGKGTTARAVANTLTRAKTSDGRFISWKEHLIDDEQIGGIPLRGGDGLQMADLDLDGYDDIVSVHEDNHHIRIAFGSADPNKWQLITLGDGEKARGAEDVSIADANGDGYPDIVVACELAHLIYFQNPTENIRLGTWPQTIPEVTLNRGSFIRAFFADLDGDGRPEVLAANKGAQLPAGSKYDAEFPLKEISYFKLPVNPLDGNGWKEQVLARVKIPLNAQPVDLDGDGDLDVLGSARGEGRIFWMENAGKGVFREHKIVYSVSTPQGLEENLPLSAMSADFNDFNKDGRLDIIVQTQQVNDQTGLFRRQLVWLEQPAAITAPWPIHLIGDILPDMSTGIALGDINDDSLPDLITGGYSEYPRDHDGQKITASSSTGRLAWFEQPKDMASKWIRHDISRRKRGMYDAFIPKDMDGDGDLDFVTTRGNSGNFDGVLWLEQVRTDVPVQSFQAARANESAHLPLPPAQQ